MGNVSAGVLCLAIVITLAAVQLSIHTAGKRISGAIDRQTTAYLCVEAIKVGAKPALCLRDAGKGKQ